MNDFTITLKIPSAHFIFVPGDQKTYPCRWLNLANVQKIEHYPNLVRVYFSKEEVEVYEGKAAETVLDELRKINEKNK